MIYDLEALLCEGKRTLFVGIGNLLKSDDGVGVYISTRINNSGLIQSLTVEASIENYIGKINTINPDILVLIDCAEIKSPPGSIRLLPIDRIKDLTFNTHSISLKRLSEFFNMPVYILGIQPEKIEFGENISYIVKEVADRLIKVINKEEVYHANRISVQSLQGTSES
jgi:hydrogenase 3 maturation protease